VDWRIFCTVLVYGLALTCLFITAAWLAYRHKQFSRGDIGG